MRALIISFIYYIEILIIGTRFVKALFIFANCINYVAKGYFHESIYGF